MGCHFLLQEIFLTHGLNPGLPHCRQTLYRLSHQFSSVAQSCPTLCDPMDCSLQGSSIHGIFQARVQEWVAISFSRGSSRPRDPGLWHCSQTLYRLHHQGSPKLSPVRRVYAPLFCLVHNKDLERRILKPLARHSSRVLDKQCYSS